MQKGETEIFHPVSHTAWRKWLEKNHLSQQAVWLVFYNKRSGKKSVTWSDAVDVALCFGWIDSRKIKIDEETSHQYFSRRKAKSTWSKINKRKVQQLTESGLMTEAGYKIIETAKQNGWWTILDDIEELIVPEDLKEALRKNPVAKKYFQHVSKSVKKAILQSLILAKRPETRQKRITEINKLAEQTIQMPARQKVLTP